LHVGTSGHSLCFYFPVIYCFVISVILSIKKKKVISQPPTSLFFGGAGSRPFLLPLLTSVTSESKVKGRFRINPTCLWSSSVELKIPPFIVPHSLNYSGKVCVSPLEFFLIALVNVMISENLSKSQ